jgi:hypothetical protein
MPSLVRDIGVIAIGCRGKGQEDGRSGGSSPKESRLVIMIRAVKCRF